MSLPDSAAPVKEQRKGPEHAQAQRDRIVEAAGKCFVEKGFHAASIAEIAVAAGMSQGLLYRYFENKASIVRAMIDHCLSNEVNHIIDELASPDDALRAMLKLFEVWVRGELPYMNAALMMETAAESTRDTDIAATVRYATQAVRARLEQVIRRSAEAAGVTLAEAELSRRVLKLQLLVDGMAVRALREPDLDRATLQAVLQAELDGLLITRR